MDEAILRFGLYGCGSVLAELRANPVEKVPLDGFVAAELKQKRAFGSKCPEKMGRAEEYRPELGHLQRRRFDPVAADKRPAADAPQPRAIMCVLEIQKELQLERDVCGSGYPSPLHERLKDSEVRCPNQVKWNPGALPQEPISNSLGIFGKGCLKALKVHDFEPGLEFFECGRSGLGGG
jgi:hypothetical protein